VYAVAISYFMEKKQIKDPVEALYKAQIYVSELPYWKDKVKPHITLEKMNAARVLLAKTTQESTTIAEEQPPTFFISYDRASTAQTFLKTLITDLEANGYQKREQIDQAQYEILLLSKNYFDNQQCKEELDTILTTKKTNYVFPVWEKEVDKAFLQQQEQGEKILGIVGVGWNDWQGTISTLTKKVMQLAQATQGLKTYDQVPLIVAETQFLKEVEKLAEIPIPALGENELQSATVGFHAENNRIISLVIVGRNLPRLPTSIGQCLTLSALNLSNNYLEELPDTFGQLQNLDQLTLQRNPLKALPPSFKTVHKHLIPRYPEVLEAESLVLGLLELLLGKKIPKVNTIKYNTLGFTARDGHVTGLGFFEQVLTSLPESIGDLTKLETLWLEEHKFSSLPESFGNLVNLQSLNLERNQLTSLPESFGNLRSLQTLNLEWNRFTSLPESFGNLTNLEELNLDMNRLTSLPASFGNLMNLKKLTLFGNELTSLPASFGNLISLKKLSLFGAHRFETPPECLEKLHQRGCDISD